MWFRQREFSTFAAYRMDAVSCQIKSARLKRLADYLGGSVHWRGVLIGEGTFFREDAVLRKAQNWFLLLVTSRSYFRLCVRFVKASSISYC